MLEMRPGCERCDADLAADAGGAWICSFECTFCSDCRQAVEMRCPNCGGDLAPRPRRAGAALERHPASTRRVYRPPAT